MAGLQGQLAEAGLLQIELEQKVGAVLAPVSESHQTARAVVQAESLLAERDVLQGIYPSAHFRDSLTERCAEQLNDALLEVENVRQERDLALGRCQEIEGHTASYQVDLQTVQESKEALEHERDQLQGGAKGVNS